MKCCVCDGECPEYGSIILNVDGDIACSESCRKRYGKEREHFLNVILPDDEKLANWLGVSEADLIGEYKNAPS